MRKLALVSAFAALLAATGLAAAQQAVVDDPPGSLYQNQGICESDGDCDYWQPRHTHAAREDAVTRARPVARAPARKEIARPKHSN